MSTASLTECRAEYAAGSILLALRWFARVRTLQIRSWYWDDWFSVSSWVFFSLIYSMVEYLAVVGAPIGLSQEQREALDPATRASYRKGAIGMFASFYFLIFFVWSVKGTLIVFFLMFTKDTAQRRYIVAVAWFSVLCFVTACITQTTHCLPLNKNWQILPNPGNECSEGIIINIVIAVGNVSVDALLLVIPTLMLKDAQIGIVRKIKIISLLSLGVFVIGMAITRCIFSIGTAAQVGKSSEWAQREALVSILAANAPVLNSLFKSDTWSSKKKQHSTTETDCYASQEDRIATRRSDTDRQGVGRMEIYKMTDVETTSKEGSTLSLVDDHGRHPEWQGS